MKLSEAIRCGALLTKPTTHAFIRYEKDVVECCALGAAAFCFAQDFGNSSVRVREILAAHTKVDLYWPIPASYPKEIEEQADEELGEGDLEDIIIELNDRYEWPREKIADWLERIGY